MKFNKWTLGLAAIGVVSTNNIAACLVNGLPGWLVRELG